MKSILGIALLVFVGMVGMVGWRIGGSLSSDALGMAVGILFGIMAGIPATLILLASARREEDLGIHVLRHQVPPKALEPPKMEQHIHFHYHGAQLPAQPTERLRRRAG
ncbi:MAG: hypothetical protein KDE46_00545 [Caldilineaceae bacterium]|nr:hypothetical protein [Caldilineaceae bacterium]